MLTTTTNSSTAVTIETVKAQFAHWRATRTKIEKIPESLWDNVRKLAKNHGQGKIATELGLNGTQLRNKLACKPNESISSNKVAASSFIEASFLPLPSSSSVASLPAHQEDNLFPILELTRPDGVNLKATGLGHKEILSLVERFLGQ